MPGYNFVFSQQKIFKKCLTFSTFIVSYLGIKQKRIWILTLSTHNEKKVTLTAHLKYNIKCQILFYIWVDLFVILEREAVILYFYIICWCGFNIIRYTLRPEKLASKKFGYLACDK